MWVWVWVWDAWGSELSLLSLMEKWIIHTTEIFYVAPFEKNPKLIIFHLTLHIKSIGLLESLFR